MKLTEVTNEATEILSSDHFYLTRDSEPLPEDKLKYILGSNLAIGGSSLSWVHLRDKKTQGTAGGNFTAGAWQTRDLNDEVYDGDSICSLSSNQIQLDAGTYFTFLVCPALGVSSHQARLQNITLATTLLLGNAMLATPAYNVMNCSIVVGVFTVSASQVLEIQHWCTGTNASGFGAAGGITDEIYTQAIFVKIE